MLLGQLFRKLDCHLRGVQDAFSEFPKPTGNRALGANLMAFCAPMRSTGPMANRSGYGGLLDHTRRMAAVTANLNMASLEKPENRSTAKPDTPALNGFVLCSKPVGLH